MAAAVGDDPADAPGFPISRWGFSTRRLHTPARNSSRAETAAGRSTKSMATGGASSSSAPTSTPSVATNAAWFESIGGPWLSLADPDPLFVKWFDGRDTTCALQRPDFYLYGTAPTAAAATSLLADLRHHLVHGSTA